MLAHRPGRAAVGQGSLEREVEPVVATLELRAVHLLQWHAIQWARERGVRTWDLGGISDARGKYELAARSGNLEAVNALLDRLQQDREIRTAQTRKHYERAVKSFGRWLAATGRLDRDPLDRLEVTDNTVRRGSQVFYFAGTYTPSDPTGQKRVRNAVASAILDPARFAANP